MSSKPWQRREERRDCSVSGNEGILFDREGQVVTGRIASMLARGLLILFLTITAVPDKGRKA
jgi:hypothetical protein